VLTLLEENLATQKPCLCPHATARDFWSRAVLDPCTYSLHASLLPDESPSRRRRHHLEGLIFQLQDEGERGLKTNDKRALVSHRDGLHDLHTLLWAGAESPVPQRANSSEDLAAKAA